MLLLSTLVGRENPSPLSPPKLPGVRLASAGGSLLFVFDCRWGSGAQLSAQPMGQGNEQERAACRQDVRRFRQAELQRNLDDTLSITGCLQAYRTKISRAWLNASNSQHKLHRPLSGSFGQLPQHSIDGALHRACTRTVQKHLALNSATNKIRRNDAEARPSGIYEMAHTST
jgi:hypothetical protein